MEFILLACDKLSFDLVCAVCIRCPGINYFIYGHRHIELDLSLNDNTRMLILGDWINSFSYAVFDGETMYLENFIEGETIL